MFARFRVAEFGHLGQGRDRHVVDMRHELGAAFVRFADGAAVQTVIAGQGQGLQGASKPEVEADPRAQLVRVERLYHVVVGPGGIGANLLGTRGVRRDHDHLNGPTMSFRSNAAADLVAVNARQHDVEHDDVGGESGQNGKRLFAAGSLGQAVLVLEQAPQQAENRCVVVNNQDFLGAAVHGWLVPVW